MIPPRPVKDGVPITRAGERAIEAARTIMIEAGFPVYAIAISMLDPAADEVLTQSEIRGPACLAAAITQSILAATDSRGS